MIIHQGSIGTSGPAGPGAVALRESDAATPSHSINIYKQCFIIFT